MPIFKSFTIFALTCVLSALPVSAAEELPLEITADTALEWNQTAKTYIARGNALAQQGEMSVAGDVLTAEYAGEKDSTSDLTKVTAEGHVMLKSATDTAIGDKAVYDLVSGVVTLTGTRPKVVRENGDILEADQMVVFLKDRLLDHAEATGNVIITMAGEKKATGDKGIYTRSTNVAELVGNVKIMQGANWLEGDKAEMNLTTKVSKMIGAKNRPRVKGIFYPSAGKKK
ncbi:MAG TPA: LptA/OstA family protein [Alphaproteobacteria bacterium]|nr:LptA/OstA family protein [Alphaproteobacteria bacterium]